MQKLCAQIFPFAVQNIDNNVKSLYFYKIAIKNCIRET